MPTGFPDYSLDISGTLQVGDGGTGNTALPAHEVLLGNGIGPVAWSGLGQAKSVYQTVAQNQDPLFQDPDFNNCDITPLVTQDGLRLHGWNNQQSPAVVFDELGTTGDKALVLLQEDPYAPPVSGAVNGDLLLYNANAKKIGLQSGPVGSPLLLGPSTLALPLVTNYNGRATAGQGLPIVVATSSNGALTGATSYTVTLVASSPGANWYRITGYIVETDAGVSGSTTLTVGFYDGVIVSQQLIVFAPSVANTPKGAFTQGTAFFRAQAGTAITLIITTGNTAAHKLYVCTLEQLN
jgi:hypothetical protein